MAFGDNDAVAFGLDDEEEGAPKGAPSNTKGTLAALGDVALGAMKVVPQTALTLAAKAMSPREHNLDELWKASGELVEDSMPSIGNKMGVSKTAGYTVPLKPFEVAGKVIDSVGNVVSEETGSKDLGGAVKIAANFLPIPGTKLVGKGFNKAVDRFHRDSRAATAAEAQKAATTARDVLAQEQLNSKRPETIYVDPEGTASGELATKIEEAPGVLDEVKRAQAEELNTIVKDIETPKNEQLDLFEPEQKTIDFSFGKDDTPVPETPAVKEQRPGVVLDKEGNEYNVNVSEQAFGAGETKPNSILVEIRDPATGERRGMVDFHIREDGVLVAENAKVAPAYKGKGLAEQMYKAARDAGYDIAPGRVQTDAGLGMVEALQRKGIINKASDVPQFRAGDLDIVPIDGEVIPGDKMLPATIEAPRQVMEIAPPESRPVLPDTVQTPRTPETLAARANEQKKANLLRKVAPEAPLKEWLDVNTREEAMSLAKKEKDIGGKGFAVARNAAAGIHGNTIMSGHPALRYVRKLAGDARANIARMSQEYITNKKNGLVTSIQKLNGKEAIQVMELLSEGDKLQFRPNEAAMEKLGFNEKQKQVVRSFQRAADAEFALWNEKKAKMGFEPVPRREGWLPGVFKGNYKTIVWDKDGHIVGMIAQDTKWQQSKAVEYYKKTYPGAKIGTTTHIGLGRNNRVDAFSGLNDVLAILAKEDPKMAELLGKSQEARALVNNDLFGVGKHELQKKGISGNEGNRPWLNKERNAKDAMRSMVDYFETAFEHHELQPLLKEIDTMVKDPEFTHNNAKKYLQDYGNHISGKTSALGAGLNGVLDGVFDAFGIGTSIPLEGLSAIKAGMSRYFMGFNPAFLASQFAQPFQMAFPLAGSFATRLGMPQGQVASAMGRGAVWATAVNMAKWYDKPVLAAKVPQYVKDAIEYANSRGLYAFNELELAHQATKGKTSRVLGQVADFSISTGDKMTKLPTYLGFVELFKDAGIDSKIAFALAEKATESSMVSYHPWERPMMYQKMGALGQFAGGLTTYKHSNMNLQSKLAQEAFGKQKNLKPLMMSGAAMLLFAGMTGLPAYGELDTLYGTLKELIDGKPSSIREDFLQELPEMIKSGAVSAASNLNMQAKWSSADMVPDTLAKAASPHLEGAYQIADAAAQYALDPSQVNRNNLLMKLTPTGLKGFTENAVMKDEQGYVLDNKGLPKFSEPRSESNWNKRKWTGVGLLDESIESSDLYKDIQAQKVVDNKIAALAKQAKTAYIGNEFARAMKILDQYREIAGPEAYASLLTSLETNTPVEKTKGARERLQGTPSTTRGLDKYGNYNDGN